MITRVWSTRKPLNEAGFNIGPAGRGLVLRGFRIGRERLDVQGASMGLLMRAVVSYSLVSRSNPSR